MITFLVTLSCVLGVALFIVCIALGRSLICNEMRRIRNMGLMERVDGLKEEVDRSIANERALYERMIKYWEAGSTSYQPPSVEKLPEDDSMTA